MCSQPLPQPELGNKSVDEHDAVQTKSPQSAHDYLNLSEKQPTKTAQTEYRLPASPQ